ncbi:hypothetical protein AAY473_013986 [Plecturocebus cupreus]
MGRPQKKPGAVQRVGLVLTLSGWLTRNKPPSSSQISSSSSLSSVTKENTMAENAVLFLTAFISFPCFPFSHWAPLKVIVTVSKCWQICFTVFFQLLKFPSSDALSSHILISHLRIFLVFCFLITRAIFRSVISRYFIICFVITISRSIFICKNGFLTHSISFQTMAATKVNIDSIFVTQHTPNFRKRKTQGSGRKLTSLTAKSPTPRRQDPFKKLASADKKSLRWSLTLSPRLEYSGTISADCTLSLPGSSNSHVSDPQVAGISGAHRHTWPIFAFVLETGFGHVVLSSKLLASSGLPTSASQSAEITDDNSHTNCLWQHLLPDTIVTGPRISVNFCRVKFRMRHCIKVLLPTFGDPITTTTTGTVPVNGYSYDLTCRGKSNAVSSVPYNKGYTGRLHWSTESRSVARLECSGESSAYCNLRPPGFKWFSCLSLRMEMSFTKFARMVSICLPCDPPRSASQTAGITGMSQHARPRKSLYIIRMSRNTGRELGELGARNALKRNSCVISEIMFLLFYILVPNLY